MGKSLNSSELTGLKIFTLTPSISVSVIYTVCQSISKINLFNKAENNTIFEILHELLLSIYPETFYPQYESSDEYLKVHCHILI